MGGLFSFLLAWKLQWRKGSWASRQIYMLCKYHPVLIPWIISFFFTRGYCLNRFRYTWEFLFYFFLFLFFFIVVFFLIFVVFQKPDSGLTSLEPRSCVCHARTLYLPSCVIYMYVCVVTKKISFCFHFSPHPHTSRWRETNLVSRLLTYFSGWGVGEASVKCTYFLVRCPLSFSSLSYQYPILGVLLLNRGFFRRGEEAHLISHHFYAGIFPYDK